MFVRLEPLKLQLRLFALVDPNLLNVLMVDLEYAKLYGTIGLCLVAFHAALNGDGELISTV